MHSAANSHTRAGNSPGLGLGLGLGLGVHSGAFSGGGGGVVVVCGFPGPNLRSSLSSRPCGSAGSTLACSAGCPIAAKNPANCCTHSAVWPLVHTHCTWVRVTHTSTGSPTHANAAAWMSPGNTVSTTWSHLAACRHDTRATRWVPVPVPMSPALPRVPGFHTHGCGAFRLTPAQGTVTAGARAHTHIHSLSYSTHALAWPGQARPGQARPGQARPGQARSTQAVVERKPRLGEHIFIHGPACACRGGGRGRGRGRSR
jgi:hypothetical protein